jgi:hypothetical protein
MLIEQLAGAVCALLIDGALGPGTAEPRAIGSSFLLRPLPRHALLELFQVDQIPHACPRHAGLIVIETMRSVDECVRVPVELTRSEFGGYAQGGSILIYEIPHYAV